MKADLDFDQRETVTETYQDPKTAPRTSQSTSKETYTGAGTVVGGVLGPENVTTGGTTGPGSDYAKESTQTAFAVGKVTEQAKAAPGAVKRMSVAVVLDARASGTLRTDEVTQLVSAAVGLDPARGDVVEVRRLNFDQSAQERAGADLAAAAEQAKRDDMLGLARTGGAALFALVVLFLVFRSLRRDRRVPVTLPGIEVEQITAAERERMLAMSGAPRELERSADPRELQRVAVREEIGDLVERQPDEVAQLLRGWLADRRS